MVRGQILSTINKLSSKNIPETAEKLKSQGLQLSDYLESFLNLACEEPRLTVLVVALIHEIFKDDQRKIQQAFASLLIKLHREISEGLTERLESGGDVEWSKEWKNHGIIPKRENEDLNDVILREKRIKKHWIGCVKLVSQIYVRQNRRANFRYNGLRSLEIYIEVIRGIQVDCQAQLNCGEIFEDRYKQVISYTVEGYLNILKLAGFKLNSEAPDLCEQICTNLCYWRDKKWRVLPNEAQIFAGNAVEQQLLEGWLRVNIDIELEKKERGFDDVLHLEAAVIAEERRNGQHDLLFDQYILPLANTEAAL